MTGNTEHQDDNSDQNSVTDNATDGVDNIVDLPLGTDKQSLKDAADAILKSGPAAADDASEDEFEDEYDENSADPLAALVNDLKVVHAQKDEMRDQLLRSVAEMENLRKRTRKEVADAREFAISSFARDLLSVSDNLRRAVEAVPEEEAQADAGADSSGLKNLLDGVSMTERELHTALEKHKVKKMSPKGDKFDPNFHQAMFEVEDKEIPNNTVVEVIQDGYVIGERMLRPAMVGVSKGGPKTPKPAPQEPE